MKSILETRNDRCKRCGKTWSLERHHVFYGTANRRRSEEYGLTVTLCHWCHNEPPNGVHFNSCEDLKLKRESQKKAMEHYGWTVDDFRHIFGRSYI